MTCTDCDEVLAEADTENLAERASIQRDSEADHKLTSSVFLDASLLVQAFLLRAFPL